MISTRAYMHHVECPTLINELLLKSDVPDDIFDVVSCMRYFQQAAIPLYRTDEGVMDYPGDGEFYGYLLISEFGYIDSDIELLTAWMNDELYDIIEFVDGVQVKTIEEVIICMDA